MRRFLAATARTLVYGNDGEFILVKKSYSSKAMFQKKVNQSFVTRTNNHIANSTHRNHTEHIPTKVYALKKRKSEMDFIYSIFVACSSSFPHCPLYFL